MDDRIRIYKGYAKSMKFLKVQSFFLCVLKNFYGKSQLNMDCFWKNCISMQYEMFTS
jgi:hypothetical protein